MNSSLVSSAPTITHPQLYIWLFWSLGSLNSKAGWVSRKGLPSGHRWHLGWPLLKLISSWEFHLGSIHLPRDQHPGYYFQRNLEGSCTVISSNSNIHSRREEEAQWLRRQTKDAYPRKLKLATILKIPPNYSTGAGDWNNSRDILRPVPLSTSCEDSTGFVAFMSHPPPPHPPPNHPVMTFPVFTYFWNIPAPCSNPSLTFRLLTLMANHVELL